MKVWEVIRITQELDGSNYVSMISEVFSTEKRAREYYNYLHDRMWQYADEVIDDDDWGFTTYEYSTPLKTMLSIQEKELQ